MAFVELFALAGIAIAAPAFDLLGNNASLFVTRRTTPLQLVGLTLLLVVAPALVLWGLEVVIGLVVPRLRRWAHAAFAGALLALLAVEVLRHQSDLGTALMILTALALGGLGGYLLLRAAPARMFVHFLAVAPVIFGVLFVFASPASSVVMTSGPSAASVDVGAPNRVVFVMLDEFPTESLLDGSGRIDSTLFPNLAALAGQSTWYRNNTTVAPFTETAVPSILSGSYPKDQDVLPAATKYPHNLFTLLGKTYDMNVYENRAHLCPPSICGSERTTAADATGFSTLVANSTRLWYDFAKPTRAPEQPDFDVAGHPHELDVGDTFIQSLTPSTRPRLDFVHLLLPHEPWHYAANGQDYHATGLPGLGYYSEWLDDGGALSGRQRHLLQVQATDRLIGRMVAKLKRIHAYDDSLIVVTADHGVAFTTGSVLRGVAKENYPEIMWTPLIVKAPRQMRGAVDDRVALGVDLLPTIADHLRTKLPWKVDGRSLLGAPRTTTSRRILEWDANLLQPPPGQHYVTVDGAAGFASVRRATASTTAGDPRLRLFGLGGYAGLVGKDPTTYIDRNATPTTGRIVRGRTRAGSDPRDAPWLFVTGKLSGTSYPLRNVVVAVNGVIAAVTISTRNPLVQGSSVFSTALPPTLVHGPDDRIDLYLAEGNGFAPTLVPVTLTSTR
jgi:hypothetical protein